MVPSLSAPSSTSLRLSLALAAVALVALYVEPAMACFAAGHCGPCPTPVPLPPFSNYFFNPSMAVAPMLALGLLAGALSMKWRWYSLPAVVAVVAAWANCYAPPLVITEDHIIPGSHCADLAALQPRLASTLPVPDLFSVFAIACFLTTAFCFFARRKDIIPTLPIHQFRPTHRLREVNID